MSSPKLLIRRMVVSGDLKMDQRFSPGLNIIQSVRVNDDVRSTNGCGKTSLVELIQHGFGKTHESKAKYFFAPIIGQIDTLWLEFETREGVYTIERSLTDIFASARLHEGPIVAGIENSPAESVKIDDMSKLLLRLVGIPEVAVATRAGKPTPLSFRLLMRAFVLHQEDSFQEILSKVDPESRKAEIIGFLTGITPLEHYSLDVQVGVLRERIAELETYSSQVTHFLEENSAPVSLVEVGELVNRARLELEQARNEQLELQVSIAHNRSVEGSGLTDTLRSRLLEAKRDRQEAEQSILGYQQELHRLRELIASLKNDQRKSRHLQASTLQLSNLDFDICPRCLQTITGEMRHREDSGRCMVCNRPMVVNSDALPVRIPRTDDLELQTAEASDQLSATTSRLQESQKEAQRLGDLVAVLGSQLDAQTAAFVSPAVDQLVAKAEVVSERQANLARANQFRDQAIALDALRLQVDALRKEMSDLEDQLRDGSRSSKLRREELRQTYASVLRAVDFPKLLEIDIASGSLMPYINGALYIHQGTALKGLATVCYHLALLNLARTSDTHFPKMLVVDSPNTGDLNEDNHTKLLRYLANMSAESDPEDEDWQIILTTRYLPTGLERFVVETVSNPSRMLLRR